MRWLALGLAALTAAGCAPHAAPRPPAPPPDASLALADTASGPVADPLPIVALRDGRSDTLALGALVGAPVTFLDHPDATVDPVGDGRVVLRVAPDAPAPVLVPFEAGGVRYVIATRPDEAPGLRLRLDGFDAADPSLLVFVAARHDGAPPALDDEDGVALAGNRILEENALDVFEDRLVLDLDAVGPGRRRIRVIAAPPDAVSNWVEVDVVDGRLAE